MTLRELLEELRSQILRDTSSAVGAAASEGALHSDESLINYIRDAEVKFAIRTACLRDSRTDSVCLITLVEGQSEYDVSKRIINVFGARYDGRINLGPIGFTNEITPRANLSPSVPTQYSTTPGEPRFFYTDSGSGVIGVVPAPGPEHAGKTIRLTVTRKPLVPLTKSNLSAEPEIPEEYHLDLLGWAAFLALSNNDSEINGDPANISIIMARNNVHKKRFNDAVDECKTQIKNASAGTVSFATPGANWR